MTQDKPKIILIVEDDLDVADMLNAYFRVQGYDIILAHWGQDGIDACHANNPDLIILDIRLPDMDGFEVAAQLRGTRRTENIPIIFLTEKRGRTERLKGLELGADDYITKPFDIQELRLRVRNALRRASQGMVINPITGLPELAPSIEKLEKTISSSQAWGLMLVQLANLDAFREMHGCVPSDDVLRAVSLMMQNTLRDLGQGSDFAGHLGPADFLIITSPGNLTAMKTRIETRLNHSLDYFYPIKTREKGEFTSDRPQIQLGMLLSSQVPEKTTAESVLKTLRRQLS